MGKYDGLGRYLRRQRLDEFELSFTDVERLILDILPKSASRPQWWANERGLSTHVQCAAWMEAGFDAFLLPGKDRVRFVKRTR